MVTKEPNRGSAFIHFENIQVLASMHMYVTYTDR